jgi:hypothetical protein
VKYYDLDGNPCSLEQWEFIMATKDPRRVAEDTVHSLDGCYWVSTVWLGIDHGWNSEKPVLWETMIFAKNQDPLELDQWCQRYTSRDEALEGHRHVVEMLRNGERFDI